jgi:hypothetical protein
MKTINTMKTCCAMLGAAALLAAPNLFANVSYTGTITVTPAGGNANGGGEFKAIATGGLGTFETFCLYSEATGSYNTPYNYVASDTIIPNDAIHTVVSIGAAWLYSEFRSGNLTTFVSSYAYDGASKDDLQEAIWKLQNDPAHSIDTPDTLAGLLITAAVLNAVGTAEDYNVFALNLTDDTGASVQPLLGWAPVPEPSTIMAGALLLLPFGVSTLRIMRKNKMQ